VFVTLVENELDAVVKLEPVDSKLVVLVENEPEAVVKLEPVDSKLVTLVENEPDAVVKLEPVDSVFVTLVDILEEYELKDEVNTKLVESRLSSKSALEAKDAEAIDPDIVMPPVVVILPVNNKLPDMANEPVKLTGIYYVILIIIKLPFLYNPPKGTPLDEAAASSTKFND